jgi:hypothetical protein
MRLFILLLACTRGGVPVQMMTSQDMAQNTPRDFALGPQGCLCLPGNYCDLTTNTCKPGCAFNTDCPGGQHCNATTHMCFTPGTMCGGSTCSPGQQCCLVGGQPTCAASCITDMGTVSIQCMGPSDCPSLSSPICCAHIDIGASPGCSYAATVMCQASCAFQPPLGCGTSGQGEVCTAAADCKDAAAPNCCTFTFGGQSGNFCVSNTYKGFSSGCL